MSTVEAVERTTSALRRNMPICVVDDDASMLDVLLAHLAAMGFPAFGTTKPEEALEQVRAGRCRVVIADIKMPGMDGSAFLEKVLRIDPGVYVILISGSYSMEAAIDVIRRGAYDYLCKPLDRSRLERTLSELAELFGQRRQIRELEE
ncbi:MAG: response regulator, partial [Firmicutes bacterium]|nr:response regulator [Bacillota bacterium]